MENFKDIFKILFALQLLVCSLATYGHPDAELIDFGSPTQPSRDQLMIEAAIKRGMDGEAVAELLRTRQPVVRTTTTPTGFTKTTTYKLEPDGSISSKSVLQKRHRYTYNSDSIPDDLKNSPSGTVTKTFTDSDGNKVTQTFTVNRDKPASGLDTHDLDNDWFNKAFSSSSSSPAFSSSRRTVTRTYSTPSGERRTVQSWSSDPEIPQPDSIFGTNNNTPSYRRTSIRTYPNPSEGKRILQTTSTKPEDFEPKFPGIDDVNWSSWGDADMDDFSGWEVVNDPEVTTTKKNFESWTPKIWNWPEFPTPRTASTTTTTTPKPKLYIEPEPSAPRPLPSLDDFLKSQYGQNPKREPTSTTTTSTAKTSTRSVAGTTPKSPSTTPKFIQIENLPVAEVLHNGKPADEDLLKTLPAHLTPKAPTEQVIHIEHKHPIEEDMDEYTPKVDTNIRSYSTTHIGPEKPRLKDLDPQMQDILRNAGIVPEIEGDSITKTRTEPDGRVITTTYKVNTIPSPPTEYSPPIPHLYAQPQASTHTFGSYQPRAPLAALTPSYGPISEFLALVGLTKFDIVSRNGRYSKTLIDENGDVLTATFVLTSSRSAGSEGKPRARPYK